MNVDSDEPEERALALFVVYDHPSDAPQYFAVRKQYPQVDGSILVDGLLYVFHRLDDARSWLDGLGLTCLARLPDDDPLIIETWI